MTIDEGNYYLGSPAWSPNDRWLYYLLTEGDPDFDELFKVANGTGPFKLVSFKPGDRIELARNEAWWGGSTPWERVTLRILPQDASRVAALLSGDVQAIESVPTTDVAQLRKDRKLAVYRIVADRLTPDQLESIYVTGAGDVWVTQDFK